MIPPGTAVENLARLDRDRHGGLDAPETDVFEEGLVRLGGQPGKAVVALGAASVGCRGPAQFKRRRRDRPGGDAGSQDVWGIIAGMTAEERRGMGVGFEARRLTTVGFGFLKLSNF